MILRFLGKIFSLLFGQLKMLWLKIFNVTSLSFYLSDRISPFSHLSVLHGRIIIGNNCKIDSNSVVSAIDGTIVFGDGCSVNRNCMVVAHESIMIGKNVMIGPNVVILDHDHKIRNGSIEKREYVTSKITIEDGAWIGANCTILKGVTVGKNAIVAAGSIVTHDCPDNSVMIQKRKTDISEINKK